MILLRQMLETKTSGRDPRDIQAVEKLYGVNLADAVLKFKDPTSLAGSLLAP